jgi:large subunit ribosomal protein LP2
MRYVAAYLLAVLGGNANPKESDIEKILTSVGVGVENDKLSIVMKALAGKNVEEVIAAGKEKLASVPSGGAAPAAASAAAPAAGGAGGAPAAKKEEEKKKEESEEEDEDMGFGLFD